jgi:hypothetical protein
MSERDKECEREGGERKRRYSEERVMVVMYGGKWCISAI